AFALACEAGQSADRAGLGARALQAQASSPLTDFLGVL
ncbi:MAG: thiazole synthase, partial [Aeromonas sp.]